MKEKKELYCITKKDEKALNKINVEVKEGDYVLVGTTDKGTYLYTDDCINKRINIDVFRPIKNKQIAVALIDDKAMSVSGFAKDFLKKTTKTIKETEAIAYFKEKKIDISNAKNINTEGFVTGKSLEFIKFSEKDSLLIDKTNVKLMDFRENLSKYQPVAEKIGKMIDKLEKIEGLKKDLKKDMKSISKSIINDAAKDEKNPHPLTPVNFDIEKEELDDELDEEDYEYDEELENEDYELYMNDANGDDEEDYEEEELEDYDDYGM